MSKKTAWIAAAMLAAGLACTSAHAKDVYWSVGVNAPLNGVGSIGTVVSNHPGYGGVVVQSPAYYPAPAYYPVYQEPVRVYRPAPPVVYYPPPRVVYEPYYYRAQPRWDRRDYRRDEWREHHHHHGR